MSSIHGCIDYGADSGGRIKGLTVIKGIVYGSISMRLPHVMPGNRTHKWKVFLKPYLNEDMSTFIKKVRFILHESYEDRERICHEPPYKVEETGYGEFVCKIRIYFKDPNERCANFEHLIKLGFTASDDNKKALLISECYDEIVFKNPSLMMNEMLQIKRPYCSKNFKHYTNFEEKHVVTLENLRNGTAKLRQHNEEIIEEIRKVREEISKYKLELQSKTTENPQTE